MTATGTDGTPTTYTTQAVSTQTPGLADNGTSDSTSSGMSTQTRNIIIGVVVGVVGAIVLAGGALIARRVWGRKKQADEHDGLMSYNNGYGGDKPDVTSTGSSRTPFQSTLESYHAPTNVNTASNF